MRNIVRLMLCLVVAACAGTKMADHATSTAGASEELRVDLGGLPDNGEMREDEYRLTIYSVPTKTLVILLSITEDGRGFVILPNMHVRMPSAEPTKPLDLYVRPYTDGADVSNEQVAVLAIDFKDESFFRSMLPARVWDGTMTELTSEEVRELFSRFKQLPPSHRALKIRHVKIVRAARP